MVTPALRDQTPCTRAVNLALGAGTSAKRRNWEGTVVISGAAAGVGARERHAWRGSVLPAGKIVARGRSAMPDALMAVIQFAPFWEVLPASPANNISKGNIIVVNSQVRLRSRFPVAQGNWSCNSGRCGRHVKQNANSERDKVPTLKQTNTSPSGKCTHLFAFLRRAAGNVYPRPFRNRARAEAFA